MHTVHSPDWKLLQSFKVTTNTEGNQPITLRKHAGLGSYEPLVTFFSTGKHVILFDV